MTEARREVKRRVKPPLELTENERYSDLWIKLKGHYEQRLHDVRVINDKPLDHDRKMVIVGQIKEIKELLGIESPARTRGEGEEG